MDVNDCLGDGWARVLHAHKLGAEFRFCTVALVWPRGYSLDAIMEDADRRSLQVTSAGVDFATLCLLANAGQRIDSRGNGR